MAELVRNYLMGYAIVFGGLLVFSLLTNTLFLKFVHTLGIRKMDSETIIRWGPTSKPALGGFNFYLSFLLCIATNSILFDPNQYFLNKEFIGLLLCVTLGFIIGLSDDAYDTQPLLKLTGQLTCATILIITDNSINLTPSDLLNSVLTILWVVGFMNSINMLDNMDAVSGLISVFICLACMVTMYAGAEVLGNIHFIILLGCVASLLGFLWYNWNPSQMYMGDTGSQFLGALLSVAGIKFLWNFRAEPGEVLASETILRNMILVSLTFIVPLVDTTIVVVLRMARGQSPLVGGKDHTTHNMARFGLSDRTVAFVCGAAGFISVLMVTSITLFLKPWKMQYALIFGGYFLVFLSFFFALCIKGGRIGKY